MKTAISEISEELRRFTDKNKWARALDVPQLYKNLDIIRMQELIGSAILYTAEHFGSRGSAFVTDGSDVMKRLPLPENTEGRALVVVAGREGINCVPVKPIPERELWFEKAWNKYNERIKRRNA